MEEQQLQEFVHRVSTDEALRKELASNPESVLKREGLSPRLTKVASRLIPILTVSDQPLEPSLCWWTHC
ncbi:MAG TPA: Nif11-like leader peptide family natural product precursor [Ktedonobacteraceae bacterium]|jgi:hypothetical protein|nr:Nif11-like leader peptide family natural product precursor [Ktedonobacteraceae bacterium]